MLSANGMREVMEDLGLKFERATEPELDLDKTPKRHQH
jgi:hypothetical protein